MSDDYGRKGSPGNLIKILGVIVKLLQEQNNLLKQIAGKKKLEDDNYTEKTSQPYANRTGTKRGSL